MGLMPRETPEQRRGFAHVLQAHLRAKLAQAEREPDPAERETRQFASRALLQLSIATDGEQPANQAERR